MSEPINRTFMLQAFGEDHCSPVVLPAIQRSYRVRFVNVGVETWVEVAVFYDMEGIPGSIPAIVTGVFPPGSQIDVYLCACARLYSFAWAFFYRDSEGRLFTWPEDTSQTYTTRAQLEPQIKQPCAPVFEVV